MTLDMEDLSISTNWICEDENKLKNLITFIHCDSQKCAIENLTAESCICLTKKEESKPVLNIKLKGLMMELDVFSEGSLIEVFGDHEEYLFTCSAEFVDDWEEMAVYHAKIVLPDISFCRLKFSRIKDPDRLWLYSIQAMIAKSESQHNGTFNLENINKLINDSSHQISERAEKFKKFFEIYSKNSTSAHAFNVQSLLNVINKECNAQLSDAKAFLNHLNGCENSRRKENKNEMSVEYQYLKGYIDGKFVEMKEDLMKFIDYKFAKLMEEKNSRLDRRCKFE